MLIQPTQTIAAGQAPSNTPVTLTLLEGELPIPQVGQTLQATVRVVVSGQAMLDFLGAGAVKVQAIAGMQPGMPLTLRIRSLHPQPTLELLPSTVQTAASARTASSPASGQLAVPPPVVPSRLPGQPALPDQPRISSPAPAATSGPAPSSPMAVEVSTARLGAAPLPLEPGRTLTVQVLQELPNGRSIVQANGIPLEALSSEPLPAGSMVRVRVQQVQPEVVLRALGPPTANVTTAATLLRQNLPAVPVGEAVSALLREAGPTSTGPNLEAVVTRLRALLPEGQPPPAEKLEAFVRDGGLHYEAKLAEVVRQDRGGADLARVAREDVKGLVLEALRDPGGRMAGAEPKQVAALGQHLQAIEAQQAANLLAVARGDPVLLQVPLLLGPGEVTTLHLAVQADGDRAGSDGAAADGCNLLMHLDLDSMGSVRIDAQLATTGTRVVFYVEKAEARARMQAELPLLREAIQEVRGGPVLLLVRNLQELPIEQRSAFAALCHGLPRSGSSLDVRA